MKASNPTRLGGRMYWRPVLCFVLCLLVVLIPSANVFAYDALLKRTPFYDPDVVDCSTGRAPSDSTDAGSAFIVGDSLSVGMRDTAKLESKFPSGWSVTINAEVGRPLNPAGLNVINTDPALKTAKAVVVELGTNDPGSIDTYLPQAVDTIHRLNSQAKVFWVNLAAKSPSSYDGAFTAANQAISGQASSKNYQVIDWASKGPAFIPEGDVHPSADGYEAMAKLVVDAVTGSAPVPTSGGCCGVNSTNLTGKDNAQKIYNFLTAPGRLKPYQAAGVMGNMQAESGFEPRLVQYGKLNSRGEISEVNKPSSLDDTPPPEVPSRPDVGTSIGYGIVQFTPATKILPAATRLNMAPGDLGFQLTLLWEQLNGQSELPEKAAGDHLKQTQNVEDATISFETKYERHAADSSGGVRLTNARSILLEFGSGTGSSSGGGSLTSACSSTQGNFSYGKYAGLSRQQLKDIILNAPNWKPQNQNPVTDIESGAAVDNLLRLMAGMLESLPNELLTPSVIQTGHACYSSGGGISNHMGGLAVDIGAAGHSQESMNTMFTWLFTNSAALGVDELIFDPVPSGTSTLKHGKPLVYDGATLAAHQDHIHVSVEGPPATSCPSGYN